MKKAIAMRCTEKQYNKIKSKLKHIDNHNYGMCFKEYPYLTNNYNNEFSIGTHDKSLIRPKVEIHETWNEKVFLEACGIEVEETFTITESDIQHLELYGNEYIVNYLHEIFPTAFEPEKKELVVGRWYKSGSSIFNHQESKNSYGFRLGKWQQGNWSTRKEYFTEPISEATQQEVEEALKAEAVRRGYKKGNHKCLNSPIIEKNLQDVYSFEKGKLWYGGQWANCVFKNGNWAEIIQPKKMTQAEIETELGYCVEIV